MSFRNAVDLRLTRLRAEAYIPAIGAPPASCWRDDAPLKLLTGTVKRYPMVLGCMGFDDPLGLPEVGISQVPGLFEKRIGRKRNVDGGVLAGCLLVRSNSYKG